MDNGDQVGYKNDRVIFDNLVWMTSAEAASYLRKSTGALRVMVCRRQIPARKFYRRLYFKRSELDRLLDSSESN
jgi:excisionase family DNA binding protein